MEIDVCTTAIPRSLVKRCVPTLLKAMQDRCSFSLRWLVHLDHYTEDLEEHYAETLEQIKNAAELFDSSEVILPQRQAFFGGAARALFGRVRNHAVWAEDDWLWTGGFRLADVLAALELKKADQFTFVGGKGCGPGNMHPTVWTPEMTKYVFDNFPEDLKLISEFTICKVVQGRFRICQLPSITGKVCRHVGNERLTEVGHTHNHVGQRLDGQVAPESSGMTFYKKPRYDHEKKEWVKQ